MVACSPLEKLQSRAIFQINNQAAVQANLQQDNMQEVWIAFNSKASGEPVRLHGLWQPADQAETAPIALYLHGARWDVANSAFRIRELQSLGFSVLAIDYRGFGKSAAPYPTETYAYEDALAAWQWLASQYPQKPRYIYGHSLGGAIAIDLASKVSDESGIVVEGTFTSIPDVFSTFKWGWLPITPIITQRFQSIDKVHKIGSPILVIHGSNDRLILPTLGQKLYNAAAEPKRFILIEGGTHRSTQKVGSEQLKEAMVEFFKLSP